MGDCIEEKISLQPGEKSEVIKRKCSYFAFYVSGGIGKVIDLDCEKEFEIYPDDKYSDDVDCVPPVYAITLEGNNFVFFADESNIGNMIIIIHHIKLSLF